MSRVAVSAAEVVQKRLVFERGIAGDVGCSSGVQGFFGAAQLGKNITLLSSMSIYRMGPPLAVEGATTRGVFETYLEEVLVPALRPGRVVVMDNLSAHKGFRVREIIEGSGCELLYLPPYSPDLNPIEEAFAKLKGRLRAAMARSREALIEAMGAGLDAITAQDARGFFGHCGYRTPAQPL
jgi:transposase